MVVRSVDAMPVVCVELQGQQRELLKLFVIDLMQTENRDEIKKLAFGMTNAVFEIMCVVIVETVYAEVKAIEVQEKGLVGTCAEATCQ